MNILYITKLKGYEWTGPNISVPNQVFYQSKNDNVKWINLVNRKTKWDDLDYYFSSFNISVLCKNIDLWKPDLVVFEGFYCFFLELIILFIWIKKYNYIIVPRGALTRKAQEKGKFKKYIANKIFFNKFIRKSLAIEYLNDEECNDSIYITKLHKNIIIPNGIKINNYYPENTINNDIVKILFIGRLDIYQKGLDILLEAIYKLKNKRSIILDIYGPSENNSKEILKSIISKYMIDNNVNIYEGIYSENKYECYKSHDLFIMTSRFEGHSMALLEALSYGLPVIITKGTNMIKEVEKYDAGWVAGDTSDSISSIIDTILINKIDIKHKGKNAKMLAEQYDWNKISIDSHKKYKEIINENSIRN